MGWIDYLDLENNDTSEDLGGTLVVYGFLMGIGFLMVLIGATGFFAYVFSSHVTAQTPVILGLVVSTLAGWIGMTVAGGGAVYAVMQTAAHE